jgi:sporulation protein YlmC with PRC-barrel domain
MSYETQDTTGAAKAAARKSHQPGPDTRSGPGPELMSAHTLRGEDVVNRKSEALGNVKEIMIDMHSGKVAYAVMSFGGFLGVGSKLFAVPWEALTLDSQHKRLILNIDKEQLENAPGFDKDHWPDMADPTWADAVHSYYGIRRESGRAQT